MFGMISSLIARQGKVIAQRFVGLSAEERQRLWESLSDDDRHAMAGWAIESKSAERAARRRAKTQANRVAIQAAIDDVVEHLLMGVPQPGDQA
jgi:hypothetical protein